MQKQENGHKSKGNPRLFDGWQIISTRYGLLSLRSIIDFKGLEWLQRIPRASRIQVHNANVSVMQKQENEHNSKGNPRLFVIRVFGDTERCGLFLHVSNELLLSEGIWVGGQIYHGSFLADGCWVWASVVLCSGCIKILLSEVLGRM